jgi:hypothetical protein
MTRKTLFGRDDAEDTANSVEKSAVTNYVRLCFSEGVKPSEAFREIKRKMQVAQRA